MAPSWGRGRGPRGRAAAGSLLALLCGLLGAAVATDTSTGQGWLKAYGYLLPPDSRLPALQLGKAMQSAVAAMQQFYGIPVTGVLDPTTIEFLAMIAPRMEKLEALEEEKGLLQQAEREQQQLGKKKQPGSQKNSSSKLRDCVRLTHI
ncbi:matrix metalloproteinase-24-like isoform X1 [Struthio camelus]|uniref:matrix metalloproteinase-24-like isoform X1 n=1 Tax=Struthio camelus TaxID=8801 RepID=UPI003603E4D0